MRTSRSESGNGSGRRITALITVNIARFPPMPILSESVAVSQNIGAERRFLYARRIASPIGCLLHTLIGVALVQFTFQRACAGLWLIARPGRSAALFDCGTAETQGREHGQCGSLRRGAASRPPSSRAMPY